MATISRTRCLIGLTLGSLLMLGQASASFADGIPTSCDIESGAPSGFCASSTPGGIKAGAWREDHDQDSSPQGNNNSTVGDQRPLKTAEGEADPAAAPYNEPARCMNVYVNKAPNSPTVSDDNTVDNCPLPSDPDGGSNQDPGRIPTTRDILYLAATTIHPDGAGLHKRPEGVSYTNRYIPTLVAATHPTQTHVINLLGRDITITLTATSYTWSWGGWNSGRDHDLAGYSLARRHGPQHGPHPDLPLLQGAQRVEVIPGRTLPLRHAHHHADHHVGGHGHQPLHG